MFDTVITNGLIVAGNDILPTSTYIGIKNGKISTISSEPLEGHHTIDCKGAYVTPGGIDPHVHMQEPKMNYCDTFEHATRIAAAGGTTTVIGFGLQSKEDTEEHSNIVEYIQEYLDQAKDQCYVDYGFHLIVSNPVPELIKQLPKLVEMGLTSCKIYMTYDSLKLSDDQILTIMLANRNNGIFQLIHAENHEIIRFLNEKLQSKELLDPYYHAVSRPIEAEDEASYRVIQLSKIIDLPILIVHMSSPTAINHVRKAQNKNIPVFSETCPQYLFLTNDKLKSIGHNGHDHSVEDHFDGAKYICSPPLRDTSSELEGVWETLRNGTVTILSSDHAPSFYDDPKGKKLGLIDGKADYKKIPNGLSGVEVRVPLLFSHGLETGRITPQRFAELTSTNAAKLYGLNNKKGSIAVGYDADLVIWYPAGEIDLTITNEILTHHFDYTAFEGLKLTNLPKLTMIRGQIVFDRDNGGVKVQKGFGEYLVRGKSCMGASRKPINPLFK